MMLKMQWKREIILIFGLICVLDSCVGLKISGKSENGANLGTGNTVANPKSSNSKFDNGEGNNLQTSGRTFMTFETLKNQIYDAITNITMIASGLGNDIQTTVQNQSLNGIIPSGGGGCGQTNQIWDAIIIPIFFIVPAVIIGVVILIKVIGLIVAWIPSWTGPFFESFKTMSGYSDSDSSGGGYGWGPSPPSAGYGPPPAPSSAYGTPGGLSRQTAILDAIDNLSNVYGYNNNNNNNNEQQNQQNQKMSNNNMGELGGNYGEAYQGLQSVQNSGQNNNYPYYYYQNPSQVDYSNSEKSNNIGDNVQLLPSENPNQAG